MLELLERVRPTSRTVALTADPHTPVLEAADDLVVLDFADERSVVQTRFATTALTLLRSHLGLHTEEAVRDAERALAEPLPEGLSERTQFSFLGRGWTVGLAHEAALKMKEASLAWTEVVSGDGVPPRAHQHLHVRDGDVDVRRRTRGPGGAGTRHGRPVGGGGLDPLADLVRVQRLAIARAAANGLDPDAPRHLTRSVILDEA